MAGKFVLVVHILRQGKGENLCGADFCEPSGGYILEGMFTRRPAFRDRWWCRGCVLAWQDAHPKPVKAPLVPAICPWCGGRAFLGYKHDLKKGKCADCSRVFRV
jgi:hypothetical protein